MGTEKAQPITALAIRSSEKPALTLLPVRRQGTACAASTSTYSYRRGGDLSRRRNRGLSSGRLTR